MPNGGSRRVSSGAGYVRTWQHLDIHGQPSEICALEAKYPRISNYFFSPRISSSPRSSGEVIPTGSELIGRDLTATGVEKTGSAPAVPGSCSCPSRWTRRQRQARLLSPRTADAADSAHADGCGRPSVLPRKKARSKCVFQSIDPKLVCPLFV